MRIVFPAVTVLGLAACAPSVPDQAGGSYGQYMRDATRTAGSSQGGSYASGGSFSSGASYSVNSFVTDDVPDSNNRPRGDAPQGISRVHSELEYADAGTAPADTEGSGQSRAAISDEQNFQAVKSRVSIEQDKQRLEQMRADYKQIQPQALPARPANDGPNLAAYALSTHNAVGQQIYKRFNLLGSGDLARKCGRYASPDLAQVAFLSRGGPARDPMGLDPDGDGFVCGWDPAPFRLARN